MKRWATIAVLVVLASVLAARLLEWWPCAVACAGGGAYERLAGVPITALALGPTGLALGLAWWRAPGLPVVLGLMAGGSLWFLAVSVALGLWCPFCLTVHAAVLTSAALQWSWPRLPVALLVGALGMNAVYHHEPLRDAPPASTAITAPAPQREPEGRMRGPREARLTADLFLDLTCPHCATARTRLLDALANVRVTERLVVRRGEPAGRDLARWSIAAAQRGPAAWETFVQELLGSRSGLTRDELLAAHPALLMPLDAATGTEVIVDQDQALLRQLRFDGKTPFLVLRDGDRILARRSGDFDPADLPSTPPPSLLPPPVSP